MIRYENSRKTMNKKGWCGNDFSDVAVPEKLFIIFFFGFLGIRSYIQLGIMQRVMERLKKKIIFVGFLFVESQSL